MVPLSGSRQRAEGKLKNLQTRLEREPLSGTIGIGHTRWATHGRPNETNAHPHATDRVAVVHNGIIENFRELREELERQGAKFTTETDTEVVAHLVTAEMNQGRSPVEAVKAALPRLRGAFALAFLFAGEDDLLIGARQGPPLAVGYGDGEMYLGSDAIALAPFTDTISYLEDGDWAVVRHGGAEIHDSDGRVVKREVLKSNASAFLARCRSTGGSSGASRSRPAAPPITPAWWENTGSSGSPAFRSRSTSPPS